MYSPRDLLQRHFESEVPPDRRNRHQRRRSLHGHDPCDDRERTFIINGAERVVVSQLHRSPGICFEQERHSRGNMIYSFRVIPYRGSWLEGAFDSNDLIHIYIDRKKRRRKVLATTFIRALGYSTNTDIIEEFFKTKKIAQD